MGYNRYIDVCKVFLNLVFVYVAYFSQNVKDWKRKAKVSDSKQYGLLKRDIK